MKCPDCGDKDAKKVSLFTSISYLCPNQSCRYFDMDRAVELVSKAFGNYGTEGSPVFLDGEPEIEWYLPGDIGMTD